MRLFRIVKIERNIDTCSMQFAPLTGSFASYSEKSDQKGVIKPMVGRLPLLLKIPFKNLPMLVPLSFLATFFGLHFLLFYLSACFWADSLADLNDMSGLSFKRVSCFSISLDF